MESNRPQFSGVLLTGEKDPKQRKGVGKIALWSNPSGKENAPVMQGVVQTDRGTYRIALWRFRAREEGL